MQRRRQIAWAANLVLPALAFFPPPSDPTAATPERPLAPSRRTAAGFLVATNSRGGPLPTEYHNN